LGDAIQRLCYDSAPEFTMRIRLLLGVIWVVSMCRPAFADDKYTLHENLHIGQKVPVAMVYDLKIKSITTMGGVATPTDVTTHLDWKMTMTVLDVKDGSAMKLRVEMDPVSTDVNTTAGQAPVKASCPFGGKSIVITRNADESFTNDYSGNADDNDVNLLNNLISPDEDYYPDHPVAVGDVWDVSAKMSKHSQLGPKDQLMCQCRLDWVKTINGKQMAQISNSVAIVYQEAGHVEEDFESTGTTLVDMGTQMIVKGDQMASSTYKTPPNVAAQVTGGTEYTFHDEVTDK
jgi:hypothetical protein